MLIWDDEAMETIFPRQAGLVRDAGALRELPYHPRPRSPASAWV
jgi:hypothetical protein